MLDRENHIPETSQTMQERHLDTKSALYVYILLEIYKAKKKILRKEIVDNRR